MLKQKAATSTRMKEEKTIIFFGVFPGRRARPESIRSYGRRNFRKTEEFGEKGRGTPVTNDFWFGIVYKGIFAGEKAEITFLTTKGAFWEAEVCEPWMARTKAATMTKRRKGIELHWAFVPSRKEERIF